jgi:tripartite-type tricarboxylate transporter receptor subunit TctC
MKNILHAFGLSLGAIALVMSTTAQAQAIAAHWPEKSVRVLVPYAAGSTPDIIARLIFDRVQKDSGGVFVVENKPGAAGMIGADVVAKAKPDGHTLVLAPAGPLAVNKLLYKKMPYDPLKDLAPVSLVAETPSVWVTSNKVTESSPVTLLQAMRDSRKSMAYASPGAGTLGHLNLAYLVALSKASDVPHVPYAGSPQIITALIADDVQMAALPPPAVASHIKSGKIKAIATIGPKRSSALPEVPTLKESGVDFAPVGWFGVVTTGGTPPGVLAAIHARIAKALADPALKATYEAQGLDVADKGPAEFGVYIDDEIKRWGPVVQRFGISLD